MSHGRRVAVGLISKLEFFVHIKPLYTNYHQFRMQILIVPLSTNEIQSSGKKSSSRSINLSQVSRSPDQWQILTNKAVTLENPFLVSSMSLDKTRSNRTRYYLLRYGSTTRNDRRKPNERRSIVDRGKIEFRRASKGCETSLKRSRRVVCSRSDFTAPTGQARPGEAWTITGC